MKRKKIPEGVTCRCGEFTKFAMYVYAHWMEELVFTCPKCKARYSVLEGVAVPKGRR